MWLQPQKRSYLGQKPLIVYLLFTAKLKRNMLAIKAMVKKEGLRVYRKFNVKLSFTYKHFYNAHPKVFATYKDGHNRVHGSHHAHMLRESQQWGFPICFAADSLQLYMDYQQQQYLKECRE